MNRRSGFTLLELLAVMVIMFMLMGMGTVAMKGLIRGSGRSGAASNIRGVLTQARQYAITKNQKVYVIFSKENAASGEEKSVMTVCAKFSQCDDGGGFNDTRYGYSIFLDYPLPWGTNSIVGATVYNLDRRPPASATVKHYTISYNNNTKLYEYELSVDKNIGWTAKRSGVGFEVAAKKYLPSGMEFKSVPLDPVIFKPDGSLANSSNFRIEVQEMYQADAASHTIKVRVNKYTGWIEVN